jgi:hypothetical protein
MRRRFDFKALLYDANFWGCVCFLLGTVLFLGASIANWNGDNSQSVSSVLVAGTVLYLIGCILFLLAAIRTHVVEG